MSFTVAQAYDDLRRKLGLADGEVTPAGADADIVAAINWALQTLQNAGAEYFTREAIPVTLVAGQVTYSLATTTQAVIGPVKTKAGRVLRKVEDFGEVDNFGQVYLGQIGAEMPDGAPLAYHVRDTRANADNSHTVTLYVMPAPDSAAVAAHSPIQVDGIKLASRYTVADIYSAGAIQVASGYVESLFLPLARLQVTRSPLFSRTELLAGIQEDAATAMRFIGVEPGNKPDGGKAKQ